MAPPRAGCFGGLLAALEAALGGGGRGEVAVAGRRFRVLRQHLHGRDEAGREDRAAGDGLLRDGLT